MAGRRAFLAGAGAMLAGGVALRDPESAAAQDPAPDAPTYSRAEIDQLLAAVGSGIAINSALGPLTGTAPITVATGVDAGWGKIDKPGTFAHDPTVFRTGTASGRVTVASTAPYSAGPGITLPAAEDWSGCGFGMWLRSDNWANVSDGYLIVGTNDTTLKSRFEMQWRADLGRLVNDEWLYVTFTPGDFRALGATPPDWRQVRKLLFRVYGSEGTPVNIWIDSIERYPLPSRAVVSITHDDGFATDYTVSRPKLDQYGFRATHYVMVDQIGAGAYLAQDQIDSLADLGHDISGHGFDDLTTMSLAAAEADVVKVRKYLAGHGYKGQDHYAYPLGGQNETLRRMMRKYWRSARGTSTLGQTLSRVEPMNLMGFQPGREHTAAEVINRIDRAVANREWLILAFHRLSENTPTPEDVTPAVFNAVVDHLATVDADVLPVSEAALRV